MFFGVPLAFIESKHPSTHSGDQYGRVLSVSLFELIVKIDVVSQSVPDELEYLVHSGRDSDSSS